MLLIFKTSKESGLTESIALEKFHVRQKLSYPTHKFRSYWRAAISQDLKAAQVIWLAFEQLCQQVEHGWHEHRMGHAFALDQLTERLRIELWNRDLAHTESRRGEHGGKIGNMKNRSRMQIDTAFLACHPIVEVVEVRQDVLVSHHDALRPARSAARINDGQNCVRVINRIWTGGVHNVQRLFIEHELPRNLLRRLWERGMPHQPARFCIKQHLIDFRQGEPSVYRDCSNAEPAAGIDQLDVLRRIRQQKREAIARRKTVGDECSRQFFNPIVEPGESDSRFVA